MNTLHLYAQCEVVKEWEREIGCAKKAKERRKFQFNKFSKGSKYHRNAIWIVNWCIWITYNYIKHNDINTKQGSKIFKKNIQNEEFRYLLLFKDNTEKINDGIKCQKKLEHLTKHLRFKTIQNNLIISKF